MFLFSTHNSGHTLDLVITRSVNDVLISEVKPTLALSDHITVECKIAIPRPNLIVKEIRSRNFKQIDHQAFKSDISSSDLYIINLGLIYMNLRTVITNLRNS
jgi:hypothetical protein